MKIIDIIIVMIIALLAVILIMVVFFPKIKQADVISEEFAEEALEESTAADLDPEILEGMGIVLSGRMDRSEHSKIYI